MLVWNARFASRSNVGTRPGGVGATGDIMIRTGSNGDELHNGSDENFSLEAHGDGWNERVKTRLRWLDFINFSFDSSYRVQRDTIYCCFFGMDHLNLFRIS